MDNTIYVLIVIIAGGISIGTAMAATDFTLSGNLIPVNILDGGDLNVDQGRLRLLNASFIADRNDGVQTAFRLLNDGAQSSFQFEDIDDSHVYVLRFTGGAEVFQLFDATNNRADISVDVSNGNVGIGKVFAGEKLDVQGNIRLSGNGNITSFTDICIGAC